MGLNIKNKYNLIGKKFGLLSVQSFTHKTDKFGRKYGKIWNCKCDCGNERNVTTQNLINNKTYSCGCKLFIKPHKNKKYEENEASFRAKLSTYKAHAKRRKIEWDLSYDDGIKILKSNCHYCGRVPNMKYNLYDGRRKYTHNKELYNILCNGIDRKNSSKGYINNNIVPCCTICNFAKNSLSYDDFIMWIDGLIKFRNNEK